MTRPTPQPALTLQQPAALAPVSAPPKALVLPGGWQIEGSRPWSGAPGRRPRSGRWSFSPPRSGTRYARGVRRSRDAVLRLVRRARARARSLAQISPIAVATYIEEMHGRYRAPTIKQHLAAIRRLFDWLVTGQVVPTNPATSVRGPTHVVRTGKTPVLQPAEARQLLDTIDTSDHPRPA